MDWEGKIYIVLFKIRKVEFGWVWIMVLVFVGWKMERKKLRI